MTPERIAGVRYAARAIGATMLDVVHGDVLINNDRALHRQGGAQELLYSSRMSDVRRGAAVRLTADIAQHIATSDEEVLVRIMAAEIAAWPECDGAVTFDRLTTYTNVEKAAGRKFVHVMGLLVVDTFALVRAYWPAIERIASELVKHSFISVHQLRRMVVDALVGLDGAVIDGGAHVD